MAPDTLLCLIFVAILAATVIVVVAICVTNFLTVFIREKERTKRHEEDKHERLKIIELHRQVNAMIYAQNNRFLTKNRYKQSDFTDGTEIANSYSEKERKKERKKPADAKEQTQNTDVVDDLGKICNIAGKIIDKSTKPSRGSRSLKRQ